MTLKKLRIKIRTLLKRSSAKSNIVLLVLVVVAFGYAGYMSNKNNPLNQAAFAPLLNLIGEAESNGNYNAYFGNAANKDVVFTGMSISEVIAWQEDYVAKGSPSSAVGRYQIINTTLEGLVRELDLNPNELFDEQMQDAMALTLLERRGARQYVNKEISEEEFAANLAKEWAALPKVLGDNPSQSYYASDGLNKSRVAISEVLDVIKRAQS